MTAGPRAFRGSGGWPRWPARVPTGQPHRWRRGRGRSRGLLPNELHPGEPGELRVCPRLDDIQARPTAEPVVGPAFTPTVRRPCPHSPPRLRCHSEPFQHSPRVKTAPRRGEDRLGTGGACQRPTPKLAQGANAGVEGRRRAREGDEGLQGNQADRPKGEPPGKAPPRRPAHAWDAPKGTGQATGPPLGQAPAIGRVRPKARQRPRDTASPASPLGSTPWRAQVRNPGRAAGKQKRPTP